VTEIKLTQRALRAWAGTDRLSALQPERLARLPITMASTELALFVAGVDVPILDPADDDMFCERRGELTHARVALLPTAHGIVICDRHDARVDDPLRVCWPDDSSYHLARAIPPGRRAGWLDVGCGSGFAVLERPQLADACIGVDVNPRAVTLAKLGAMISHARLLPRHADATTFDAGEMFELVTCNPPIPDGDGPIWRGASAEIVRAMIATAGKHVAPGGLAVVHAALELLRELPGDVVTVAYTPEDARAFGIAWWQPDGEARQIVAHRALSTDRPHIDWTDRDAALAGAL
jgi:SAM-dependent methyltransferase